MIIRLLSIFAFSLTIVLLSNPDEVAHTKSSEPPIFNASGPGNSSCGSSGCHEGVQNDGNGSVTITAVPNDGHYIPNQTYTIQVSINHPSAVRFGFQMVSFNEDNEQAGSFIANAQTFTSIQSIAGIQFIGHKNIPNPNSNNFSVQWVAPSNGDQSITFYAAGNAANGDNGFIGDKIYTGSLTLTPVGSGISSFESGQLLAQYIPSQRAIHISSKDEVIDQIRIYNLNGQLVYSENTNNQNSIISALKYPVGNYIIAVHTNSGLSTQKISLY